MISGVPDLPVFVDIDGVLTETPNDAWGPPCMERIATVRKMIADGVGVVIWSSRGGEYASAFAAYYGLNATCIGKPSKCVDDKPAIRSPGNMPILGPEEFFGG